MCKIYAAIPLLVVLLSVGASSAELDVRATPDSTSDLVAQRDGHWQRAQESAAQENWHAALDAATSGLALHRKHFAGDAFVTSVMLESIANCHAKLDDYPLAIETCTELEQLRSKLFGPEHPHTINVRLALAHYRKLVTLTPDERAEVAAASRLSGETALMDRTDNPLAVIEQAEQALAVHRRLLGNDQVFTTVSLSNLGLIYAETGRNYKARPLLEECVRIRLRISNAKHPDTLIPLAVLAKVYEALEEFARAEYLFREVAATREEIGGKLDPATIEAVMHLGDFFRNRNRLDEAELFLAEALDRRIAVFGEEDASTARIQMAVGTVYRKQGKFSLAKPSLEKSLATLAKLSGDEDDGTMYARRELGMLYEATGNYEGALPLYKANVEIAKRKWGERYIGYAYAENSLSTLYTAMGQPANAERCQLRAYAVIAQTLGPAHFETSVAEFELAQIYISMHDHPKALNYLLVAWKNHSRSRGENHPTTIGIIAMLANVYDQLHCRKEAEKLMLQAIAGAEKIYGTDAPAISSLYDELARHYELVGRYEKADAQYRKVLRFTIAKYGDDHPQTAAVRANFARSLLAAGKYREARQVIEPAVAWCEREPQNNTSAYSLVLFVGGLAELALGNVDVAAERIERCVREVQLRAERNATVQCERQQLFQLLQDRSVFHDYLSLPAHIDAESAYACVLSWKGTTATRVRRCRQPSSERGAALVQELQKATLQLANMALRVPPPTTRKPWHDKLLELSQYQEAIDTELAYECSQANKGREPAIPGPKDLKNVLPAGTALVDFYQYDHVTFAEQGPQYEQRFVAFVVRPEQPIVRVDLGRSEPIELAVERYRRTRGFPSRKQEDDPAATLGELIWQPLEKHLVGCETVLISPDGALARMPWSVLPGREPGSYLIEDLAIGVIPIPQLIPEMLATSQVPADSSEDDSLLLVGDVDYSAPHGGETAVSGDLAIDDQDKRRQLFNLDPLPETARETQTLRELFKSRYPRGRLLALEKDTATETAFRSAAPRYRWIHLATHGFFAPPNVMTALAAQSRPSDVKRDDGSQVPTILIGYSNGLAMTGANQHALGNGDDGILMAAELATFDLRNVEVVVLSGCETGLGEVAVGEGALGLQRSLQISGVHTTVTSLWNVADEKTRMLMERFYKNLWEHKLPKLAALREAQLWLLRGGDEPASARKRLSPHYWAAFTLSGDWR